MTLLPIDADSSPETVRAAVRDWLDAHLPGAWRTAADEGGIVGLRTVRSRDDYEAWYPTFAESGMVVPHWPVAHLGLGVGAAQMRVIEEEIAPYHLGRLNILGINLAGTTILEWGTPEQQARFLPPIVRNEQIWCQLFSEPGAGSDLPSLATRAVRDGENWIVTGQKVWTTWAHFADLGMLLARTDPDAPKRDGITWFAFDLHQPGVEVRPLVMMSGDSEFNEVFMDGAVVADANRIGPQGAGWRVARTTLSGERAMISGAGSGAGVDNLGGRSIERLIDRAMAKPEDPAAGSRVDAEEAEMYATSPSGLHPLDESVRGAADTNGNDNEAAGDGADAADMAIRAAVSTSAHDPRVRVRPWDDPLVRQELMALWTQKQVIRWTNLRARANRTAGRLPGAEVSVGKLLQTHHNMRLQEAWVMVAGMDGVAREPSDREHERLAYGFLRSRANAIEGGSTEIQKNTIGEQVLGLPREPDPFHGAAWRDIPRS